MLFYTCHVPLLQWSCWAPCSPHCCCGLSIQEHGWALQSCSQTLGDIWPADPPCSGPCVEAWQCKAATSSSSHLQMERGWVTAVILWWWWWKWEQTKEGPSCTTEHTDKQGQGPSMCTLGEPTCMDVRYPPAPLQPPKLTAYFWCLCVQWTEVRPVSIETQGKDEAAQQRWTLMEHFREAFPPLSETLVLLGCTPCCTGSRILKATMRPQNALCMWWGTGLLLAGLGSRAGRVGACMEPLAILFWPSSVGQQRESSIWCSCSWYITFISAITALHKAWFDAVWKRETAKGSVEQPQLSQNQKGTKRPSSSWDPTINLIYGVTSLSHVP